MLAGISSLTILLRTWNGLGNLPEVGDSKWTVCWKLGPPMKRLSPNSPVSALPDTMYSSELGIGRAKDLSRDYEQRWVTWVGPLWVCPAVVDFRDGQVARVYIGKP